MTSFIINIIIHFSICRSFAATNNITEKTVFQKITSNVLNYKNFVISFFNTILI